MVTGKQGNKLVSASELQNMVESRPPKMRLFQILDHLYMLYIDRSTCSKKGCRIVSELLQIIFSGFPLV